ncbi:butyrate kinase [Candidatus Formimonas warabiya]|uniref:Probable butyrate kinase n=1 Tax=Formimonas warabiya TaxID=1761012 RepID=A0A3G1KPA2_FORW1|nr:butyrate kinase [Candidatus Formimonas warabiya]ATW24294.1 butyrate kinase [Candidatus Formimonas warabiya]
MSSMKILAINPGSTSTKVAVSLDKEIIKEKSIPHSPREISSFKSILEQCPFRKRLILGFFDESNISLDSLNGIVARGGFLKPVLCGTYRVNEIMCHDLRNSSKEHASNLGALIAKDLADSRGIPAFIVDPIAVDEMTDMAKISGLQGVERKSLFHALNQKAVARKIAEKHRRQYEELNLIVAHLGGGITVGAHQKGRVIDVNNGVDGDGPFSPERTGGLPVESIVEMCFESGLSKKEVYQKIKGRGGLVSYLETNDARVVEALIKQGNRKAFFIFEAMAYQIAKEIGGCAAVLKGKVDFIVLTGGLAYSKLLVDWIRERINFIAPVEVSPGENELEALTDGAYRVLNGLEKAKEYGE